MTDNADLNRTQNQTTTQGHVTHRKACKSLRSRRRAKNRCRNTRIRVLASLATSDISVSGTHFTSRFRMFLCLCLLVWFILLLLVFFTLMDVVLACASEISRLLVAFACPVSYPPHPYHFSLNQSSLACVSLSSFAFLSVFLCPCPFICLRCPPQLVDVPILLIISFASLHMVNPHGCGLAR